MLITTKLGFFLLCAQINGWIHGSYDSSFLHFPSSPGQSSLAFQVKGEHTYTELFMQEKEFMQRKVVSLDFTEA